MRKSALLLYTGVVYGALAGAGACAGRYWNRPVDIYQVADVNRDNRPDFIVRTRRGERYVFLSQSDGTYKNLENSLKDEMRGIEKNVPESARKTK